MAEQVREQSELIVELSAAAGGLAHEIRNALSTVRMNLQMLDEDWGELDRSDKPVPPEALDAARRSRQRVGTLLRETKRLESILDDFLQFITRRKLNVESADLNHVLADLVEFFRPQAEAAGVDLRLSGTAGPLPCRLDVNLIKQAVLNLMINAQQAMVGGGQIEMRLSRSADGAAARLEVADSGPGIPADRINRIFEAYFSTKKGGTGLGLTLARQIVNEHGGTISVKSSPAAGTCFVITLPLEPAAI